MEREQAKWESGGVEMKGVGRAKRLKELEEGEGGNGAWMLTSDGTIGRKRDRGGRAPIASIRMTTCIFGREKGRRLLERPAFCESRCY